MQGEALSLARPFRTGVVEQEEAVTETSYPGRNHHRIDRNPLPALGVGWRSIGHAPGGSALTENHRAEIAPRNGPGHVRVLSGRKTGGTLLRLIAGSGSLHPFGGHGADRYAPQVRLTCGA